MTIVRVRKQGTSHVVTLPNEFVEANKIEEGDLISITVTLVTKPKKKKEANSK